ncbi:MAG: SRPBCC family protein [Ornithinimicrobium sp.]
MILVTRSIPHPSDALWQVLSDVREWPTWLPTVDALRAVEPERPDGVGASYVLEQPGLPRATWTITDWRPGVGFTWRSRTVGILSTGRHELEPVATGTVVRLSIEWTGPLAWVVRLGYGRKAARYVEQEAQALDRATATRAENT